MLILAHFHSFKFKEANDLMTGLIINEDLYNLFPNIINFKNYDTDSRKTWNELTEKEKYELVQKLSNLNISKRLYMIYCKFTNLQLENLFKSARGENISILE